MKNLGVLTLLVMLGGLTAKTASSAQPKPKAKPSVPLSGATTPTALIKDYEGEIKTVIQKFEGKKTQSEREARLAVLRKKVRRFFDFRELGRLSLDNHWAKLNGKQREDFMKLFVELIENSYLKKSQDLVADYNIEYGKEQIEGNKATVVSKIKKEDLDVEVVYELKKKEATWVIFNVIVDNLNLLNNYRSQFNKIISQKSFNELLRIMRNRKMAPEEI